MAEMAEGLQLLLQLQQRSAQLEQSVFCVLTESLYSASVWESTSQCVTAYDSLVSLAIRGLSYIVNGNKFLQHDFDLCNCIHSFWILS